MDFIGLLIFLFFEGNKNLIEVNFLKESYAFSLIKMCELCLRKEERE